MNPPDDLWRHYPAELRPQTAQYLAGAGGFSGAAFWKAKAAAETLCLRRWPAEHPSAERLRWIHDVLVHVHDRGFQRLPLPFRTASGATFVACDGHLWELTFWMPGAADFRADPSDARLRSALQALAEFHLAAADFPLDRPRTAVSPGILERLERLQALRSGGINRLRQAIPSTPPEPLARIAELAQALCGAFEPAAAAVEQALVACRREVPLQPCIRDIWHDHVFFRGSEVSGLVDFGSLRVESVATDLARLAGSLVADDTARWQQALACYAELRPLSPLERQLVSAFDQSSILMSGLSWVEWIFAAGRVFEDYPAIASRMEQSLRRLRRLAAEGPVVLEVMRDER